MKDQLKKLSNEELENISGGRNTEFKKISVRIIKEAPLYTTTSIITSTICATAPIGAVLTNVSDTGTTALKVPLADNKTKLVIINKRLCENAINLMLAKAYVEVI